MKFTAYLFVCALSLSAGRLAAGDITGLILDSHTRECVTDGHNEYLTPADGDFIPSYFDGTVSVQYAGEYPHFYNLSFRPPKGETLAVGKYAYAEAFEYSPSGPQMDISNSCGSHAAAGAFTIKEIVVRNGQVERFHAVFWQRMTDIGFSGPGGTRLSGEVWFHASSGTMPPRHHFLGDGTAIATVGVPNLLAAGRAGIRRCSWTAPLAMTSDAGATASTRPTITTSGRRRLLLISLVVSSEAFSSACCRIPADLRRCTSLRRGKSR
ncbi:hypothetical protein BH18VER1_BH18VER1_09960 [soil metagenome]